MIFRSSCDEDEEEDGLSENGMELDRPLTSDETRRLAESWKKRYSIDTTAERSPLHENIDDVNQIGDPHDSSHDPHDANDASN